MTTKPIVGARHAVPLRMEKKFKKTPAGEIPVEWEAAPLGELCSGKPEYGANVSSLGYQPDLPRYVRITDIMEDGSLSKNDLKSIKRENAKPYILSEGDIVFARSGATVGKTYLYRKADGECAFAGYLIRFKPDKTKLLPEYVLQVTHSTFYYQWVKNMLRAGAQPNINGSEYAAFLFPLPPLPEQKKIAEILSSVDEAIEKVVAVIGKTKQLKKGLMQKLLTRGLGHKKFKKTELGDVPAGWEVSGLGKYLDVYSGYAFKSHDFLEREERGIPVVKIGNLQNGIVIFDDKTDYVPEKLYDELVDFRLGQGDVLIALSGATTGKISVVHEDLGHALVNQRVGKFKILDAIKMLPEFFYYLAQADVFKKIVLVNIGKGAQENLSPIELKKSLLPVPPIAEQRIIAKILSAIDNEISQAETSKQNLEQTKKSLMQVLLTGKVRVKEG